MSDLDAARARIRASYLMDETEIVQNLIAQTGFSEADRAAISARAKTLVEAVRANAKQGLMESFLAEYGLATDEGVALMSLAEALLRVPDSRTMDLLISDKVGSSDWSGHFGSSKSPFVNFSSWALGLTADVLGASEPGPIAALHAVVRRLGEPVIRTAVGQAMRMLGSQFVFGRTIEEAMRNAQSLESEGWRFSFDMLGEAARTAEDAERYQAAYSSAIAALARRSKLGMVHSNPGISVKLSALHPRYEFAKRERVVKELVERVSVLARAAKAADMTFNIDAEEAERLDLSLDVIEAVLVDPALAGWDGFGVVVQAYGRRVVPLIDWLTALAHKHDRKLMVRLVKGAYWDAEVKRAQMLGLASFPVFTRKAATDVSYMAAARRLFEADGALFPQFATHNAHTAASILHLAQTFGRGPETFEFQRLHGMGEHLHRALREEAGAACRIYAPVGPHKDLLAYLVRRLLENGANGSFVYQIADKDIPAEAVAADPITRLLGSNKIPNPSITPPPVLFGTGRQNSAGWDLADTVALERLENGRNAFRDHAWSAGPMIAGLVSATNEQPIRNPANPDDLVGTVIEADTADIETAIAAAEGAFPSWSARSVGERADLLRRTADLYEAHAPEFFALLSREAGKGLPDGVSELREAVDFLRYYATEAERNSALQGRGVFTCISPWNFPLAIFTGQIAAALVVGNAVLAKPAETTPLIAARAIALMHEAGIPRDVVQLLPGTGATVGVALTSDPRIAGVCFTGSLPTAHRIDRAMAGSLAVDAPLIAETGGLNAMIVDSTALTEQAVRDILASSFQSAGQRCSALRVLYVQEEAAERTLTMLKGAMDELELGDPWHLATDIGPVITEAAKTKISEHVQRFSKAGKLIKQMPIPPRGSFVGPAVLSVSGIDEIGEEIFGPVLHVATFKADQIDTVIEAVNASAYGLTFGLHTRISSRVEQMSRGIRAGNIYVNRNQIGAVVGSQPFGGEGLSGTGPKAGGPHYLPRFARNTPESVSLTGSQALPGPTGESNVLSLFPRGIVLCLGPTQEDLAVQIELAVRAGNSTRQISGNWDAESLAREQGVDAVAYFGRDARLGALRQALSQRDGVIVPLMSRPEDAFRLVVERHVCIDTTAAGGNASLLSQASGGY